MYKPKSVFRLTYLSAAMSLAACGGDSNQSASTEKEPELSEQKLAVNGVDVVAPNQDSYIDLRQFITGDNVSISNVTTDTNEEFCGTAEVEDLRLKVNIKQSHFCQYRYNATQASTNVSEDATVSVLATSADNPTLPPISDAVSKDDPEITYDLPRLLGSNWESTFSLVTESVEASTSIGLENSLVTNVSGNTIKFMPTPRAEWVKITYVLTDSAAVGEDRLGVIYITVSEEANTAPTITPTEYIYESSVIVGQSTEIHLDSLAGLSISDPDGESWQLTHSDSFTASADPLDRDSVENRAIDFQANTVGEHFISYIVADHSGGSRPGLLKVNVIAKESSGDWDDINTDLAYFSAPLTYQEADEKGYKTASVWDEDVSSSVASFTQQGGEQYCLTNGSIPSVKDFQHLFDDEAYASELAKWPISVPYLALEKLTTGEQSYKTFDLQTGDIGDVNENSRYFVTCSKNRNMSLDITNRVLVADGEPKIPGMVTMPTEDGTFDLDIIHSSDLSNAPYDIDITLSPGYKSGNNTDINASSTKAGTFIFSVTDADNPMAVMNSPTITFVGDENTGQFGPEEEEDAEGYIELTAEGDGTLSDGYSTVKVLANLSDVNANPLEKQLVHFTIEDPNGEDSTIWDEASAMTTNKTGDVSIYVANTEGESVDVVASWLRPNGTSKKGKATISFAKMYSAYPCEGLEDRYGCLPVLPYKTGTEEDKRTLFTAGFDADYAQETYGKDFWVPGAPYDPIEGKEFTDMVIKRTNHSFAEDWCETLGEENYLGRDNWKLPEKAQLLKLYDDYSDEGEEGSLFTKHGWPLGQYYWTNTTYVDDGGYTHHGIVHYVYLWNPEEIVLPGTGAASSYTSFGYTSCVSVPK